MEKSLALNRGIMKFLPLFLIALSAIGIDQLSKYLIRVNMELGQSIPSEGWIRLTYTTNTGGAFGIFANQNFDNCAFANCQKNKTHKRQQQQLCQQVQCPEGWGKVFGAPSSYLV